MTRVSFLILLEAFLLFRFDLLWIEPGRHIGAAHFLFHVDPPSPVNRRNSSNPDGRSCDSLILGQKCSRQSGVLLFVLIDDDLDAVIITAILAHAMRQFHLTALGALADTRQCELPVGAAAVLASLRDFPLRKSHDSHLLIVLKQLLQSCERILNARFGRNCFRVPVFKARTILSAEKADRQSHDGV